MAVAWSGVGVKWYRVEQAKKANSVATLPPDQVADVGSAPPGAGGKPGDPAPKPDAVVLQTKGNILPTQSIAISPIDVAGRIKVLTFMEGDRKKKGDVLAAIDNTSFKADCDEARAQWQATDARWKELANGSRKEEIEQAQADLDDAKANLEQAAREWERFKLQRVEAVSRKEYDQAELGYKSAKEKVNSRLKNFELIKVGPRRERIDAVKADADAARARLDRAEWRLKNCTIVAPVTGIILSKKAEEGSLVNPVVGGVSTSLCEIADLRKLEVEVDIQERDLGKVKPNNACVIIPDAFPTKRYQGYLERLMPIADRAKSIVTARVRVRPEPGELQGEFLKPNMSVSVTFFGREVTPEFKAEVKRLQDDDDIETAKKPEPKKPDEPKK